MYWIKKSLESEWNYSGKDKNSQVRSETPLERRNGVIYILVSDTTVIFFFKAELRSYLSLYFQMISPWIITSPDPQSSDDITIDGGIRRKWALAAFIKLEGIPKIKMSLVNGRPFYSDTVSDVK